MYRRAFIVAAALTLIAPLSASAEQINMLFYGNLCTSPAMFGSLYGIAAAPNTLQVHVEVAGSLEYLWSLDSVRNTLTTSPWDFVLLEDVNGYFPPSPESDAYLTENVRRWGAEIKLKAPTATIILMPQPMITRYMQDTDHYIALYESLAEELGNAVVTPVAQAYKLAFGDRPDFQLQCDTGCLSLAARYLNTLVWYNTLTGKSPLNMPDLPSAFTPADNAWLKDVAMRAVAAPEPSSLVILMLAGAGVMRRRQ